MGKMPSNVDDIKQQVMDLIDSESKGIGREDYIDLLNNIADELADRLEALDQDEILGDY